MKIISALLLAISIVVFGSLCYAQTMNDMNDEAGMKYKQADAEMTRIFKMARDACDSAGKERLKMDKIPLSML